MEKFDKQGFTDRTNQIAKEITDILDKINPTPHEAFSSLSSILLSLCESVNVTELQFKNMMQELVNMYCMGIGDEKSS